jgi:uncharacterized protein (TIGR03067 family)
MQLCRLLLLFAVAAVLGFAPAPFPRREKKRDDLQAIQGTWKVVIYEMSGRSLGNHNLYVQVKQKSWRFYRMNNGRESPSSTYDLRLIPTARPAAFDWSNPGAARPAYIGSYRLDGKRLTVILGSAARPRPTVFTATAEYRKVMERP